MAERIEQEFLINASQALNILGRLDTGFQTFESRLRSTAAAINQFNANAGGQAFQNLTSQLSASSRALQGLGNNAKRASEGVKELGGARGALESLASLTDRAGISFETFARIVQAQVIIRSINAIRDSLLEAVETAGQLQQQVALIATIATAAPGSNGQRVPVPTEEIARATRDISDSLNIDQLEVAEGLYNAISNQVGDFAESLQFTAEAGRFARATNATLAESVDTLSAVLRTYRLDASQTSRVSDVLFATIDKGRVTADELANTFGRVLPAASELGVTLEEVGAAVATISVGGLSTDETLTQVRATFSGLLKPSEALKAAFEQVGVASGEVGIRTFGFVGFLNQLREVAGGSSEQLARLFPNVRNLGGVLALTAEQGQLYADALESISNTEGLNDEAFDIVTGTNFEQLTSTVNKTQNALAALGDEIIEEVLAFQEFVGGQDAVVNVIDKTARTVVAVLPPITALGIGLLAASNAARALTAALAVNPIIAATTAVIGLTLAVKAYNDVAEAARRQEILDNLKELEEFDARQLERGLKATAKEARETAKAFDQGLRATLRGATQASREYLEILPRLREGNEELTGFVTDALSTVVDARKAYSRELQQAAAEADRATQSSIGRVQELRDRLEGDQFSRSLSGLREAQQVFALTQRSSELASSAASQLVSAARAGDQRGIERALDLFSQSQDLASNAESIAASTDNRALEARAVEAVTQSLNKQITAEQTLQQIQKQREQALEAEQKRQEAISKEVARQAKVVIDNTSLFNNQGDQFSEAELAERTRARNDALSKLLDLQFQQGDFDLAKTLGLADFARRFESELGTTTTTVQLRLENRGQEVADEVSRALGNFNSDPFVQKLKEAAGVALSEAVTPQQLEDLTSRAEGNFRNTQQQDSIISGATARQGAAANQARDILTQLIELQRPRQDGFFDRFTGGVRQLSDEVVNAVGEINQLLNDGASADELTEALTRVRDDFDQLRKDQKERGDTSQQQFSLEAELFDKLREKVKAFADEASKIETANQAIEKISNTEFEGITTAATDSSSLSSNLQNGAVGASNLASSLNSINVANLQAAAAATAAIATARAASFGGFFNSGGVTRGVDNIPAMLTAGESVLNARATARFYSQVQAMNAGQQPVFRDQGGPVSNFGDINVNINTTASGIDGRQIAESLRREMRRNPRAR